MTKRACQIVLLVAVAAVSAFAGGCSEEESPIDLPGGPITIPIRAGTWSIQEVATYTGSVSCLARDSTFADTTEVLCSFDLGQTSSPFIVADCEIDTVGGEVVFDCTIRTNLGICTQIIEIAGGGTMTDTTFDLSSVLVTRLVPAEGVTDSICDFFYGNFVDPCTTLIESMGAFIDTSTAVIQMDSTEFCEVPPCTTYVDCPSTTEASQSLESFMERAGGVDLWRQ